ncbi:DMT family transporter [Tellurirhabdus bombi]|uniref:DMT family transporter n=1 Tax=Tellurirhabdus bombi TaxID=2907205 RepID=UPI001F41417B|nr:DMT family transporter [Tellurirhabdus bombi]
MAILYYLFAFLTGVANSTQSGVNSQLRQGLSNPLLAAVGSFAIGFFSLIGLQLIIGGPIPTLEAVRQISWWKWTGGLLGAFYIVTVIVAVPRVGVASLLCLSIAGQLIAAVIYDHYGLMGFVQHSANGWRLLGVVLVLVGAILVVKN